MKKPSRKQVYIAAVIGLVILCTGAFLFKTTATKTAVVKAEKPVVQAKTVKTMASGQNYTYSGEVRGRYESQLSFQVGGKVIRRNIELGKRVEAGEVLMEIDPRDVQQSVNAGSAAVQAANAQLELAEKNLTRYRNLYEEKVVSRAQLDQYQSAYDAAVAAVRQASAQYAQGSNQLGYSVLYSDKAGIVTSIKAEVGQVVGAGQPVVTVIQEGEKEIELSIPENRIEDIRKAAKIKIAFWALPNVSSDGQIREIAPMADPVSRTYKVRVMILNPIPAINLGMTSSVAVTVPSQDQSIYVPLAAILQTKETPALWVIDNGAVHLRPVTLGTFGKDQVQVLGGISQGELVVTAGVHKLTEGQEIEVAGVAGGEAQ